MIKSILLLLSLLLVVAFFLLYSEETETLVVTSDVHISNPTGRWPNTTPKYQILLDSLRENPPKLFFNIGDFVDNVIGDGPARPGDIAYWESEVSIYNRLNDHLPETEFLHTYGPGHDFVIGDVTIDYAEEYTGIKRRGVYKWGNIDLIWFTVFHAAYADKGGNLPSLSEDDYDWLSKALSQTKNAILLWHVPIRTVETEKHGIWRGGYNLTVPPSDKLYTILRSNKNKIRLIINGHIHKPIQSSFEGIPVFLCPFFGSGCYCSIKQTVDTLSIEPADSCGIDAASVILKH